jgi:hypothetical protein
MKLHAYCLFPNYEVLLCSWHVSFLMNFAANCLQTKVNMQKIL